jgi:hypothetical protein
LLQRAPAVTAPFVRLKGSREGWSSPLYPKAFHLHQLQMNGGKLRHEDEQNRVPTAPIKPGFSGMLRFCIRP